MRQTVFTPTYNRVKTLPRVYESLKAQTFKDFEWLIIDDGSYDNTEEIVNRFIEEGILNIRYIKKENGGKWTAFKKAIEICNTPYITSIDSDDILEANTVETFENHWKMIEENSILDIAVISMYTKSIDGKLVWAGKKSLKMEPYKDTRWHDFVIREGDYSELISSRDVKKVMECLDYTRWPKLINEKCKFIGESLLWSSIGRKYRTRIINQIGRVYYYDAENSILRGNINENMLRSIMWSSFYFIKENISWYFFNPRYFMSIFKRMDWARAKLGINITVLLKENKSIIYFLSLIFAMFFNKLKRYKK